MTETQTQLTERYLLTRTFQSLDARWNKHVSNAYAGELRLIASTIRIFGPQAFTSRS